MKKILYLSGLLSIGLLSIASVSRKEKPLFRVVDAGPSVPVNGPDSSRFTYTTVVSGLDEPMEMAILPNYDIVVAERKGAVRYFDNKTRELSTISQFNVFSGIEDGLLGVAADPDFKNNNWIYFYYGVGGDRHVSQLTRFELKDRKLIQESKKVLLEVPTQRQYCCHSAGYLTFDAAGLLYLSIGDNTNAEEIEGHNPIDERPGRELADDQASTANSNDFRGKILRIKPEADGTYSIPDGNLFPKDGSLGKPEIFAMGVRNPFRMSVDPKTKYVYWGDVGPDTEVPASEGKLSYDEINQARKPGFFGYPYFLGDNEVFPDYDFETKKEGPGKDPKGPINDSPNNTGVKELPAAQPAFIWYGKGPSKKWPLVEKGGASAMAGPVYYSDLYPNAPYKLPDYYSGKLFIYDWIRKWIMAVTMDQEGNYVSMEPFLPQLKVVAPMDMQIAPDGAVYLLAYGTNWFARNTDSGIIRVEYSEGNRNPVASLKIDKTIGAAPLTVALSANDSKDFDAGDKLSYAWKIGGKTASGKELKHTFSKPGTYNVVLTVSDQNGGKGTATTQVKVGNTPPDVTIATKANRSFYWDNSAFDYQVKVSDKEDGNVDQQRVKVSFNYLPYGKDLAGALTSDGETDLRYASTAKLYASLDCKACHTPETKSIGPALKEIAKRYADKEGADALLARKIITGGSGNWGSYPMPPHADLSETNAKEIAGYILSIGRESQKTPRSNNVKLTEHIGKGNEGAYVLQASYADKGGNGIESLKTASHIVLKNPLIQLEDYHEGNVNVVIATKNTGYISYISHITHGKYTRFNAIDLNHIKKIRFRIQEQGIGGTIEMRQGSKDGLLLGSLTVPEGKVADPKTDWKELVMPVKASGGIHDLFFVFKNENKKGPLFHVDWMYFEN
ncbi:PQQ-dependent sugar dehydrogenase [Dyadobacter chenhuakuii]|uniref:PQQ-dependent sugar dehydrogenase n=1 Tax=Dyadobacter chenhuakuii TaxID=2909339 RepID=A0ABY4XR65_9BACT|nr:PQQ-dependent sugar dehydrogenase [Dyadobacter chenhuakuii]MCF2492950.1 PQQ-dependent sugar dehydrogenase [Dyadobacter chenhuakuii]USJ32761.1 PQQ-dependent sugar dehydrogenase [Dyadobacter chenhuakuii]